MLYVVHWANSNRTQIAQCSSVAIDLLHSRSGVKNRDPHPCSPQKVPFQQGFESVSQACSFLHPSYTNSDSDVNYPLLKPGACRMPLIPIGIYNYAPSQIL